MTAPVRPGRRRGRDRGFDLRTTALFFLLLAVVLCVLAFLVRTAADLAERRPLWAGVLVMGAIAAAWVFRSRWRRFSAVRCARRAARTLEEAAESASDNLDETVARETQLPTLRGTPSKVPFADAASVGTERREERPRPVTTQPAAVPLEPGDEESAAPADPVAGYAELDPDDFEQAVAGLCARAGCREVEVVGGAGDLGADVTAVTRDGRRIVIQCKRYGETNKVGSQEMQRFGGTCFTVHGADIAAIVTTSDFTAPALEYAHQCGILCVNGQELAAWCRGTVPTPWEGAGLER
ncbi:restriction endonuclease [Streptomyces smyrnaeus]|uniref:restriction endonuclease n=1 Tax=Streptomyces smyrnaeus TaxID=1387713 RepID=UPI0036BF301F